MAQEKTKEEKISAEENYRLWEEAMKGYGSDPLTPEEELVIDRMMLSHKHSQKIRFIPGEEVKEIRASATR